MVIHMKKRYIKPYTKKKSILILIVGVLGLIISFACLFIGAILQNKGVSELIYLPLCISFFPICIVDVIFLIYHQKGITLHDIENQLNVSVEHNIEVLENFNNDIEKVLLNKKLKLIEQGYYHKRTFNMNKDFINYYFKITSSFDIEQTIKEEFNSFDCCNFDRYNKCLILLIEKNDVTESDLKCISNLSNHIIALEVIPQHIHDTAFIVLIDKTHNKLYYVKPGKNKLSFYNACYKFVKNKLLK